MNTRVDFYLLENGDAAARLQFGCRLTQKAWSAGHKIYIHVANDQAATELDRLLWSFNQQSFIPHAVAGTEEAAQAPVVIGTDPSSDKDNDLLVSLADQFSQAANNFTRVVEIVAADDTAKADARERFKRYRELGVEPNTHKI